MDELNILVATDFSPHLKSIFQLLEKLQAHYRLSISLMHVIESFLKNWLASDAYKKEAVQRLSNWQLHSDLKDSIQQLMVLEGNSADCILDIANQLQPDFIMLGGKNPKENGHYKTAHTAEEVIRAAKQSVWICKSSQLNRVLCGIDGSEASKKAVAQAIKICRMFAAQLQLVSVIPKLDFNPLGLDEQQLANEEERFKTQHMQQMDSFLQQFDFAELNVETSYLWGKPAEVLLDVADDTEIDLIVLGDKGMSLVRHFLMGSVSKKVLRYASCSILIAR